MDIPLTWREEYGVSLQVPLYSLSKKEEAEDYRKNFITVAELAKHNSPDDCWVVIHKRVYDVTNFMKSHPGGWLPVKAFAGKIDASDAFEGYHPARVHKTLLPSMFIGWLDQNDAKHGSNEVDETKIRDESLDKGEALVTESKEESKSDDISNKVAEGEKELEAKIETALRSVRQELLKTNMFEPSSIYYLKMYSWQVSLLVLAVTLTLSKTYWIAGAVAMGIFWQQTAFVGHDIGHNSILSKRDKNLFWGILIGNTLMGISLGWWKQSHNVHHVVTNSVEHDPDIQHLPFLAVNEKIFNKGGFWSTYHKKRFDIDFFARFLVSIQHVLLYPVMAVARINLYVQSWVNLIIQPHGRVPYRELEMATLLGFFCWVGLLVSVLETMEQRLAWIAISHAVSGFLHLQIVLSHFPMDVHRDGDEARATGWYSLQMQTTMDISTYPMFDWVHGGLQFQVEHHMFPRLPRHNLRKARALVRDALGKVGGLGKYHEMGFISGNIYLLGTMKAAGREAAKLRKGDGGFYESPLYHGLNLEG